MSNVIYTAETLTLNGYVYNDLIEGTNIELTPVNEKTFRINSKNGVSAGNRSDGDVHDMKVYVQKNGQDDLVLNTAMNQASPVVFNGSWKRNFIRDGVEGVETWLLELGTLTARPDDKSDSVEGNGVMPYTIQFRNAVRSN